MCDRQKVIKGLECCTSQDGLHYSFCEVCHYHDNQEKHCGNTQHLMEDALALLKAQEPVKPTWRRGYVYCGKCGYKLHWIVDKNNYCPECGQAVKWE